MPRHGGALNAGLLRQRMDWPRPTFWQAHAAVAGHRTKACARKVRVMRGSADSRPRNGERLHRSVLSFLSFRPAVYFPCTGGTPVWSGVTCTNGRVTALDFSNLRADLLFPSTPTAFPVAVAQLQQLADLELNAAGFTGQLPAQWSTILTCCFGSACPPLLAPPLFLACLPAAGQQDAAEIPNGGRLLRPP